MRRNFTTLLALGQEGAERLLLHRMSRFDRVGNLFRRCREGRGGVDHKTARRRVLAGIAGRDCREIILQCLLNRFFFAEQLGFMFCREARDVSVQNGPE